MVNATMIRVSRAVPAEMPVNLKKSDRKAEPAALQDVDGSFRTTFGQRLRAVADLFATRIEAADSAGVVPEQLQKYIRGMVKPPFEVIQRLAAAKSVSLDWLASGEGEMFASADGPGGDWAMVPVFKVEASSGHGAYPTGDEEREPLAFPRALLRRLASAGLDKLVVVFNRGESNEPDIFDGDAMLVDRGIERFADDAFYVFEYEGALMVKLIERLLDGRVALKARNPGYREEILSKEEAARLTIFGRVVWRGGLV
jgi:phage repressor protein C with HTH and peptisase S24 domain